MTPLYLLNVFFDFDYAVGAHQCAHCAGNTLGLIGNFCGVITLAVESCGVNFKDLLGTNFDAETASLTSLDVECNFIHL